MSNFDRVNASIYKPAYLLEKEQKIHLIHNALRDKGEAWVIGAMVEGSIGYHTPKHALRLINEFKSGETTDWCERCDACFNCDLIQMMYFDISTFDWMEPEKANRIVAVMTEILGWDDLAQMSVSMAYPTAGF